MKTKVEIEYQGMDLIIKGDYYKSDSGDYWTAPTGAMFYIDEIIEEEINIIDMFSESDFMEIEEIVINQLECE